MAIYTLPNGSQYNTGLEFSNQTDLDCYKFIREVELGNTEVKTQISGSNSSIPRTIKREFTETSYDTYNYIKTSEYQYNGDTYEINHVNESFIIQNK